jgi:transposase-like protein
MTQGQVDETSIKVKKVWMYLYRAVDSEGNTLEFLLSPTRDAEAAKRFFLKALHSTADLALQAHPVEEQMAQPATAANAATLAPSTLQWKQRTEWFTSTAPRMVR